MYVRTERERERYAGNAYEGSAGIPKMKLPHGGIPESVIRTAAAVRFRIVTAQGVHASLQENFRSTWQNWKGGLLTRYGHRAAGPTCGHLFYGHFFDACTPSLSSFRPLPLPPSLSLLFSLALPLSPFLPPPPAVDRPTIVITFAILYLRGFSIARAPAIATTCNRARARAAIFFPLPLYALRASICGDFVCNVTHLCNAVRIFSRMHYARWKVVVHV